MSRLYKRTRVLMGSPLEITASGREVVCAAAIDAAFHEVARIEKLLSVYLPESSIARFNRLSKSDSLQLETEVLQLLDRALHYAEISGGAFDPTAGPLIDLWGFGAAKERMMPPTQEAIASTLQSVGFQGILIDSSKKTLKRLNRRIVLNLGGIAKGYAIDRSVSILKEYKISRGLVSFGSTLYGFGEPGWRIAIQHPRREGRIEALDLSNKALATSGDYERCFFHQGKRFSHLIDPRTGVPVSGVASLSVLAPTATAADALSTAAFVLGKDEGFQFLNKIPEVAALIISESPEGEIDGHRTKAWERDAVSPDVVGRRRFLAILCASVAGIFLPLNAEGRTVRYATEKEVLLRTLPEARRFVVEKVAMTADQLKQAQELSGKRFRKKNYLFLVGQNGDETVGYGIVLNVVGKKRPITFMIVIEPDGKIRGIEILLYRESKGFQIRHTRFMKQFHQKTKEDPLRLGRDIRSISGATLSSRAAAYAVRKALAIFDVSIKQGKQ